MSFKTFVSLGMWKKIHLLIKLCITWWYEVTLKKKNSSGTKKNKVLEDSALSTHKIMTTKYRNTQNIKSGIHLCTQCYVCECCDFIFSFIWTSFSKNRSQNPHKEPKNLQPAHQNTENMAEAASTLQHSATSSLVKSSERLIPKRIISWERHLFLTEESERSMAQI